MDWEERYLQQDTPWDKGAAAPPLAEYLDKNTINGSILVPGCGRGHDARLLAEQGAEVTAMDIAPTALQAAKKLNKRANIDFQLSDFLNPEPHFKGQFDWVFEHTCFCAIPPEMRATYVQSAHQVLKSGGRLLGIFFIIVDNPDSSSPPFPVTPSELNTFFGPHFKCLKKWTPSLTYPERQGGKEEMRLLQKR